MVITINGCCGCPAAHVNGGGERRCLVARRPLSDAMDAVFEPLDFAPDWCPARDDGFTVKLEPIAPKTALSKIVNARPTRPRPEPEEHPDPGDGYEDAFDYPHFDGWNT
jgi:hypothetical protein